MEKYLKILGIGEKEFNYKLIYREDGEVSLEERNSHDQDEIVKESYYKQRSKIDSEYHQELKKIDEDFNNKIKELEEKFKNSDEEEYKKEVDILRQKYEIKRNELINNYNINLKKLENAFDEIKSSALRKIIKFKNSRDKIKEKRQLSHPTAYKGLGLSEEHINSLSPNKADEIIREKFKNIIEVIEFALSDNSISTEQREKIQKLQKTCKESYKYISNFEIRKKYSEFLDNKEIEEKYSKISQFKPQLILSDENGEYCVVKKESKNPVEILLNKDLTIKKVATLVFKNYTETMNSYINQYKIKRIINNKEKIDYVYSNIDLQQLEIDEKTKLPTDPEYYNCVVNELLSDKMIKASKYNNGYIGLVEVENEDNNTTKKKYHTTMEEKELHPTEQEYLAAVMIYENKQQDNNKIKNENNEQKENEER